MIFSIRSIFILFVLCGIFTSTGIAQSSDCVNSLLSFQESKIQGNKDDILQLWEEWRENIYSEPDRSYAHALKALSISVNYSADSLIVGSLVKLGNAEQYRGNAQRAIEIMRCALQQDQSNSPNLYSIALGDLGRIFYNSQELDSAIFYTDKSLEVALNYDLTPQKAFAYQNKARIYNSKKYHKLALQNNLNALAIHQEIGTERLVASSYNTIGATYYYANDIQTALEYFKRVARMTKTFGKNESRFYAEALVNIASCHSDLNQFDSSLYYFNLALPIAIDVTDKLSIVTIQAGIAKALTHSKQYEDAIAWHKKATVGIDSLNIRSYHLSNTLSLARAYLGSNDLPRFNDVTQKIRKTYPEDVLQRDETWNELLIDYYIHQEKHIKALGQMENLNSLRDSVNLNKKAVEIAELKLIYDLDKKEKEILLLESNQLRDTWRIRSLLIAILLLSTLGIFAFVFIRKQSRYREQEQELALAKSALEQKRLTSLLGDKDRALTAQTLLNASQKEELQELRRSLSALGNEKKVNSQAFSKLIRRIDQNLSNDEGWEKMLDAFRQVQPDFIDELLSDYPKLTSSDLRLATLLRMNLQSKTIASLINISPDSVKRARNRFRQKVNIPSDVRLQDWILGR